MPLPVVAWLTACAIASNQPEPKLPPVGAAPCIACRAPEVDPKSVFSESDWASLQDDAVIAEPAAPSASDSPAHATATTLVKRPPREVWAVLTDFERWPRFMPLLDETKVERREGAQMWVAQKFSVWLYPMRHTTVYSLDANDGRMAWRLDMESPHDIAASEGHWELIAVDGGASTLVRYEAVMNAGRAVPEFLERMLRERSLGQMLAGLRGEVLRRYPQG